MKLFFFSFFILVNSFAQESCEINAYAKIVKINKIIDDSIIKKSTCSQGINKHFVELIMNANGKLSSAYLSAYFKNEFNQEVALRPSMITVSTIAELIEATFSNQPLIVSKVSSLYAKSSYNLKSSDSISIECNKCKSTGNKNIKVKVNKETSWVTAELLIRNKVFKANKSLGTMTPILTKKDFIESSITGRGHSRFFSDIKNIQFYRLNKHISAGDSIKMNDLSPKTLINYGQRVKITIKSKNINLKTIGIAKKNGKIGEFIEIETPKTKKIILGKVVGFNKAVVEL